MSFAFAVRVVKLCQELTENEKEFVISKQLLESATNAGAMVVRAEHAISEQDFLNEITNAKKEINEAIYWLDLLKGANHITPQCFDSISMEAVELIEIIAPIIKKHQYQFGIN